MKLAQRISVSSLVLARAEWFVSDWAEMLSHCYSDEDKDQDAVQCRQQIAEALAIAAVLRKRLSTHVGNCELVRLTKDGPVRIAE